MITILCLLPFQLKVKRSGINVGPGTKFLTYIGDSASAVENLRSQQGYLFLQSLLSTLRSLKQEEDFSLTAFNRSCIGIETNADYVATLKVKGNCSCSRLSIYQRPSSSQTTDISK